MQIIISTGQSVEINQGSRVRLVPGFLPACYDGVDLEVTKIESGYPFVLFHREETGIDTEGNEITVVTQHEESALSGDVIASVS